MLVFYTDDLSTKKISRLNYRDVLILIRLFFRKTLIIDCVLYMLIAYGTTNY